MTASGDNLTDANDLPDEDDSDADVDEFATDEDEDVSAELDEFDEDSDDDGEDADSIKAEVLSPKAQDARSLEIRRAIEERLEKRRQDEDIDYLDFDFDD
ncbi:MAG: hypothetical protein NXH95_01325 [Pseudomonadaceae bacterium]|nr:hypothetical protein [Pseudomonadaceae bacterium]